MREELRIKNKQSLMLRKKESRIVDGYTLIELIMVMGILAILVTFFMTSFPASQRRARDTQRRNDINQYRVALETYAGNNNGLFPSTVAQPADTILCGYLGLANCSSDPKSSVEYLYQTNNQSCGAGTACATRYVLWATLEQQDDSGNSLYWVACSSGRSGTVDASTTFLTGTCPAGL